ncbi:FG-GAP repeat domain-containing protein [Nonomuraea sp. KM90]|uniref:FG-GAP repeat domain-containing protein n=1 Tax=Nonomuraea sp. KM90 TaxID=3457428 RepID=UPI003FCE2791
MTVDKIDGRRATGLIVYEGDDGEQAAGWLLGAGPGGLSRVGRKLNEGNAAAFGDFDSDGVRDVAVGDDGSRNDEHGDETEPLSVHRTLTIYYGNGRRAVFTGAAGPAVPGDFNGDGRDDLAFGGVADSSWPHRYTSSRIFWGGSDGLRAGEKVKGVGQAWPLAASDYDGDGDDELVFAAFTDSTDDLTIMVTDGKRVLTSFDRRTR